MNIARYNLILKALTEIKEITPLLMRASSNFLFNHSLEQSIKKLEIIQKLLNEANQSSKAS
jgi:hypothetical protein